MGSTAPEQVEAPEGLVRPDVDGRRYRSVTGLGLTERRARPGLDRVTRLAQLMFGVQISSVTVLDDRSAYFPSVQGMPALQLPREQTLCDTVARDQQTLVVQDASQDPRFADIESVREGIIRFYAGRPLRDRDGTVLGSFCVIDDRPRELAPAEAEVLEELAQLAEQELLASNEVAAVSAIHTVMQPTQELHDIGWRVAATCLPAQAVGGDFFDCLVGPRGLMIGLGDVMGKGTTAALLGASVRGTLRGSLSSQFSAGGGLAEAFGAAARAMAGDLQRAESFVSFFGAQIDRDSHLLHYLDAGSGLCLLRRADGELVHLTGSGRPLGVLPDDGWSEQTTTLAPGDRLLLFSDGLLDLIEDQTSWEAPVGALLGAHDEPADLVETVRRLTAERTGLDDVTVVAVYRDDVR